MRHLHTVFIVGSSPTSTTNYLNNMNTALILGCSHAAGTDMTQGHDNSYPCIVAESLGYKIKNLAIPGGSNDAMFRIFEDEIKNLSLNDLVIVCWTGVIRTEVWNETSNEWVPVHLKSDSPTKFKNFFKEWLSVRTDDSSTRLNKLKNILALNFLAESKGIRVINVDSFYPISDFQWPVNVFWPTSENFWEWASKNNFKQTKNNHFDFDAHEEFAKLILQSIK